MGLFSSLLKRADSSSSAGQAGQSDFPELYTGMKAEVLTPANALIFVGRIKPLSGDRLDIRAESGGVIPRAVYSQPVKLRCFQKDGETFTLNGTVAQNSFDFWRVENLKYLQNSENRSFFRQNTGTEGFVSPLSAGKGQRIPCKVLDISVGGTRVVVGRLFAQGDRFQLEAAFLPGEEPFTFTCQVMRVMVRSTTGSVKKNFEYGCQFVDLPQREQERLLQSIFTLQRKMLQARRE